MKRLFRTLAAVLPCLLLLAATADAATISVTWDRNAESNLAGYLVSYGTAPGQCTQVIDVGLQTQWALTVADTRTYYFGVQAYNSQGARSGYSSEVSGSAGTTSPPAPASSSLPKMSIDIPANNSSVQSGFMVGGWAADLASSSGPGVDAVHVWAYPNPGSGQAPVFVGAATLGYSRPDVAAAFGASQATTSGFNLQITSLPPGVYDLSVFAHSAVAAAFNNAQTVRVTVQAQGSRPMMVVDVPSANGVVSGPFTVAGWALDLTSKSGSGVDAVHIWAYPTAAGAAPVFVGAATINGPRPDVAAAFGSPLFSKAGYNLTAAQLPAGSYTLAVFAHSSVVNAFNNTLMVPITVR